MFSNPPESHFIQDLAAVFRAVKKELKHALTSRMFYGSEFHPILYSLTLFQMQNVQSNLHVLMLFHPDDYDVFQVPPDLQNEVLMSLLETDPDVVDYLLRRKASQ